MGLDFDTFDTLATSLFELAPDFTHATISIFDQNMGAGVSAYNPTTGMTSITTPLTAFSTSATAFFKKYKIEEIQGVVQPGDKRMMVLQNTLTADIPPNALVVVGTKKFVVISPEEIPEKNTVVTDLQLRGIEGV